MKLAKTTSLVLLTTFTSACSTVGDLAKWDKETDSVALQITKSAGSWDQFKDRSVPKEALNDMSTLGYIGYTGLGMMFATGVAGFGLALLNDRSYGWDATNHIMFIDPMNLEDNSPENVANFILDSMLVYQPELSLDEIKQQYVPTVKDTNYFEETGTANGKTFLRRGYSFESEELLTETKCANYRGKSRYLGVAVKPTYITSLKSSEMFSEELQSLLPSDDVVVVRFYYWNARHCGPWEASLGQDGFYSATELYPSSPNLKLPPYTFVSLPKKVKTGNGKKLQYVSGVRNNTDLYYFIKPEGGPSPKSELKDFHWHFVESAIEKELNESLASND